MPIEICAVGGYREVGRNCTAVKVDGKVILLDYGLHMENYIKYTENEDVQDFTAKELLSVHAIPDLEWKDVDAIMPSHAHLDHVGAIPYLNSNAPVIGTPYTLEVLKTISRDFKLRNKLIPIVPNSSYKIAGITAEFIHSTHSTPQTAMIALHTLYGIVLYATDFKLDNTPVLGAKPNYARLQQLRGKVKLLIIECLYADQHQKMPSESVSRQMLKEVMLETNSKNKAMIISTFSSHIARLKSIIEFGRKLNRRVVFLGRSLDKYVGAAERVKLVQFSKDIGIIFYGERARKILRKVAKEKHKFLLVMTGHQGEPKSVLCKIADGEYEFPLSKGDFVVFSAKTIPSPTNMANRNLLETKLKDKGVRIFNDIHISGHAGREDLRELIQMIEPEHIMPMHGQPAMLASLADLASEMGYPSEKVHLLFNGQKLILE